MSEMLFSQKNKKIICYISVSLLVKKDTHPDLVNTKELLDTGIKVDI